MRHRPSRGLIGVSFGGALLISIASYADAQTLVTSTNISTIVNTGNTFQTLLPAPTSGNSRLACNIQNPADATEALYVGVAQVFPTKARAFQLAPGGFYSCADGGGVEQATISVTAATSGHAFVATKQCSGTC